MTKDELEKHDATRILKDLKKQSKKSYHKTKIHNILKVV